METETTTRKPNKQNEGKVTNIIKNWIREEGKKRITESPRLGFLQQVILCARKRVEVLDDLFHSHIYPPSYSSSSVCVSAIRPNSQSKVNWFKCERIGILNREREKENGKSEQGSDHGPSSEPLFRRRRLWSKNETQDPSLCQSKM